MLKCWKKGRDFRMLPAISTACLYPLETERALDKLLTLGFRRFEVFINCESEFSCVFADGLKSRLRGAGAEICSLHLYTCGLEPFLFFTEYPRRFSDGVAQYRRYFAQAARLGASFVVFHGDRRDSPLPLPEFCERFAALAAAAREEGVTLAQENVARCRSATATEITGMKRLLGDGIRFVLDVKQALRAGESPLAMADAMGRNIALVHLSDSSPEQDCLLPGTGCADLPALCAHLTRAGFCGPLVTEVYRGCFEGDADLVRARRFLETLAGPC